MNRNISVSPQNNTSILFFDGGSRGNPGKAAGAAVIIMPNGEQHIVSEYIDLGTNNEAEYTGLIVGLKKAQDLGIQDLLVKGDSQLVVNQINGQWKVNTPHLKPLNNEARELLNGFKKVTVTWVRRHENHLADTAVNQCIDAGEPRQTQPKTQPKTESKPFFPYAKGDVIKITNPAEPTLTHQGVIITQPECKEGHWWITIEI